MKNDSEIPFTFETVCNVCGKPFGDHRCTDDACPGNDSCYDATRFKATVCNCGSPLDGGHDHITCGPPVETGRDPWNDENVRLNEFLKATHKELQDLKNKYSYREHHCDQVKSERDDLRVRVNSLRDRLTWFVSFTEGQLHSSILASVMEEIGRKV